MLNLTQNRKKRRLRVRRGGAFSVRARGSWAQPLRAKARAVDCAAAQIHGGNSARIGDVVQRIGVEDEKVRALARLQRADVAEVQPLR